MEERDLIGEVLFYFAGNRRCPISKMIKIMRFKLKKHTYAFFMAMLR